eukprot:9259479-Alexandrium_andersonii.AAC.1
MQHVDILPMLGVGLVLDVVEDRGDLVIPMREVGGPSGELRGLLLLGRLADAEEDGEVTHPVRSWTGVAQEVAVLDPILLLGHTEVGIDPVQLGGA